MALVCADGMDGYLGIIFICAVATFASFICCGISNLYWRALQCDGRNILEKVSNCSRLPSFFAVIRIDYLTCLGLVIALAINTVDLPHECLAGCSVVSYTIRGITTA